MSIQRFLAVPGERAASVSQLTHRARFTLSARPVLGTFRRRITGTPFAGCDAILIARITPDGGAMSLFTYLGGSVSEAAAGISLDSSGNVWITGDTSSADFPTTPDAIPVRHPLRCGDVPSNVCLQVQFIWIAVVFDLPGR